MKILLLQSILADYRVPVFQSLCDQLGDNFKLAYGTGRDNEGFKTQNISEKHWVPVKNIFLLRRKLQIQVGMWGHALRSDVVIFEMNPRIISTWLLIFLRKLRRKPCVLWGHAWPRSGSGSRSDFLRNALRQQGDVIVVYTEGQATELRRKMPRKRIIAAPNALYSRQQMAGNQKRLATQSLSNQKRIRTNFIFVGRLIAEKKPALLLEAFIAAAPFLADESQLIFVGDGPERKHLEAATKLSPMAGKVIFKGHVSDPILLSELYSESIASVSPGYAGLSITQSFAYGVPMLIARDEPHAPEIEAAIEGTNCLWFKSDSAAELSQSLQEAFRQRDEWNKNGKSIIEHCSANYSIELMTSRLIEASHIAFNK